MNRFTSTFFVALVAGGCATTQSRKASRSSDAAVITPEMTSASVYGHYVRVRLSQDEGFLREPVLRGELIAVDEHGIWVRTGSIAEVQAAGTLRVRPRTKRGRRLVPEAHRYIEIEDVRFVTVNRYSARPGLIATSVWAAGLAGTTLVLTAVVFASVEMLAFVVPAFVGGGIAVLATYGQSRKTTRYPSRLREYARFPQGAPPGWPDVPRVDPPPPQVGGESEPANERVQPTDHEPTDDDHVGEVPDVNLELGREDPDESHAAESDTGAQPGQDPDEGDAAAGDDTCARSGRRKDNVARKSGSSLLSGPWIYLSPAFLRGPVADRDERDARKLSYRWGLGSGYLWRRGRFIAALGGGFGHVPLEIDGTTERCTETGYCVSAHEFVIDSELRLGGGSPRVVGYGLIGPGVALGHSRRNQPTTGSKTVAAFSLDVGAGVWGSLWRGLFLGGEVAVNLGVYHRSIDAFHSAARVVGVDPRLVVGWHFRWRRDLDRG